MSPGSQTQVASFGSSNFGWLIYICIVGPVDIVFLGAAVCIHVTFYLSVLELAKVPQLFSFCNLYC